MRRESIVNLCGKDVFAAGDDHVLRPIHDVHEAVLAHEAGVTGMHPAAAQRCAVRSGLCQSPALPDLRELSLHRQIDRAPCRRCLLLRRVRRNGIPAFPAFAQVGAAERSRPHWSRDRHRACKRGRRAQESVWLLVIDALGHFRTVEPRLWRRPIGLHRWCRSFPERCQFWDLQSTVGEPCGCADGE